MTNEAYCMAATYPWPEDWEIHAAMPGPNWCRECDQPRTDCIEQLASRGNHVHLTSAHDVAAQLVSWGYQYADALDRANIYILQNYSEVEPLTVTKVLVGVCSTDPTHNPHFLREEHQA